MSPISSTEIPSPSSRTWTQTASDSRQAWMRISVSGGRIFSGVVEQVKKGLFEENGIDVHHRQVGRQIDLDTMLRKDLARALEGAADDLSDIVEPGIGNYRARLELRHVEEIRDEPVEAFRLLDDRRHQVGLLAVGQLVGEALQRLGRPEHRCKRRLEVVR